MSDRLPKKVIGLLTALYLAARIPGLRDLPVFGDEAIKLHWAALVRENPFRYGLVSMEAPLPPLHTWLLALVFPLSKDPVLMGRMLSVVVGALSLPVYCLLCLELLEKLTTTAGHSALSRTQVIAVAALLFVFCPYLALSQRLALVESLFLFEAISTALLSLALAARRSRWTAVGLGLSLGAAMLTRQNLSYLLLLLAPGAFILTPPGRRVQAGHFAGSLTISLGIALTSFGAVLLSDRGPGLMERLIHTRLLIAPLEATARLRMAVGNCREIWDWLWTYLTPPVLLLAVLALGGLLWLGQLRLFAFLMAWLVLTLAPLIVFGRFLFSRYAVLAAVPLLAAVALFVSLMRLGHTVALVVVVLVLVWPACDVVLQLTDWRQEHLVPVDRWQFVTGWPAGASTEEAARLIRRLTRDGDSILLIPPNEGNPMDSLWLFFSAERGVHAYSAGDVLSEPLLRTVGPAKDLLLEEDPWKRLPPRRIDVPSTWPVYHVSPEPLATPQGRAAATEFLRIKNPGIQEIARFWNPPPAPGESPTDGVVVYRVR